MKKGWNNPFYIDPAAKSGLSPDPGILRALAADQRNRRGIGGASGYAHGVTFGRSQPVRPDARAMGQGAAGTRGVAGGPAVKAAGAPEALSDAARVMRGTGTAGSTGSAGPVRTGSLSAGKPGYEAGAAGNHAKTGSGTANKTASKNPGGNPGRAQTSAASRYADGLGLLFSEDDLLRGFIMAEVLGRPKCLRRGGGLF
ncbi:MAG TPA: hypothetical protein PK127_09160 [Clostridiales bacterium]|nr:hypothetical protein [Clostridiales bacterium]HPV02626.1 hypothetical protein [Clostridiales bacterium]